MKKALLIILVAVGPAAIAQQTTHSWDFDNTTREYIQYVPPVYDGSEAVPLVLALHGLGDTMGNFVNIGMNQVADTADFIVVYPQALVDAVFTNSTAWNSGAGTLGISLNGDVDDVGFLNAVMDTLSAHFNIDQNRIYVTGFSMGGFMTNRLACELNNRIAAAASVAGTIGNSLNCNPGQGMRVCHFQGTADTQVGYGVDAGGVQDNTFGNNASDWIAYWTDNNNCGNITLEGAFPNTASDGYDVEYVEYAGCDNGSRVVHYKVNGADHVWLGPNNDIFYTVEIWKFFLGLSPDNLLPAGISNQEMAAVSIYPNPADNVLTFENLNSPIEQITIFNVLGESVRTVKSVNGTVDVSDLNPGVYLVRVDTEKGAFWPTFIKE